ncbi:hypothetical protein PHMEG_0006798 [Phytophthora megakarya]|uniref:Uncharacterized protein n=1 Tax=Phytophthora megakarya TaxID=4795 RepID=A0A225WQ59_9STRA|nr:hypothetical protein PHMEG_0006798 [Phytophthora megakarya]
MKRPKQPRGFAPSSVVRQWFAKFFLLGTTDLANNRPINTHTSRGVMAGTLGISSRIRAGGFSCEPRVLRLTCNLLLVLTLHMLVNFAYEVAVSLRGNVFPQLMLHKEEKCS